MVAPSHMKGRTPVKIPLHSVMDILSNIHDLGHSDQFRQAAEKEGAFVTVHPKAVNFVKDYLANNNLHQRSAIASNIVGACPGPDPYQCPYSKND